MAIGTIYYLIPDIFRGRFSLRELWRHAKRGEGLLFIKRCFTNNKSAIGGIKVFYQHVKYLRELGYDAHAVAMGKYDGNIYYSELGSKSFKDIGGSLKPNDIVVATEFRPYDALVFKGGKRVLFAQSWVFLKQTLKAEDRDKSYRDMGFDYVISCGDFIKETIKKNNNEQCFTISNAIDDEVFYADPSVRIENRVIVLPRKNPADIEKIIGLVKKKFSKVEFYYAEGLNEKRIAEAFRCSDIFLSSGYPEGLPLPPMEAMCSGAVVVGFSGQGGLQYMIDGITALVSDDGDCQHAASNLIKVLSDEKLKETLRQGGAVIMKDYTLKLFKKRIGEFYGIVESDLSNH